MSSWTDAPQWLPRRRQRASDASPSVQKPGNIGRPLRRRVTSGGSVVRGNHSHSLFGDSTTGADSELDLSTDKPVDDNMFAAAEDPICEPLPFVNPEQTSELGELPQDLSQREIDDLHESFVAQNLQTVNDMAEDEWMFD